MGDYYSNLADMVKAMHMYSTAAVHGSPQVHTHTHTHTHTQSCSETGHSPSSPMPPATP